MLFDQGFDGGILILPELLDHIRADIFRADKPAIDLVEQGQSPDGPGGQGAIGRGPDVVFCGDRRLIAVQHGSGDRRVIKPCQRAKRDSLDRRFLVADQLEQERLELRFASLAQGFDDGGAFSEIRR